MGNSLSGKSLIFNILGIIINLIGLTFLLFGYHEAFEDQAFAFKITGYLLFFIGLGGIWIFKGWLLFGYISRVLVGGLFIVSGLIKANDPLGFSYKLEEYFEDGALAFRIKEWFGTPTFSLEFFIEHALLLSIVICVVEIVLGAMAILGTKFKLASWSMLIMMVFFTFLTWHTKECDPHRTFKDVDYYDLNSSIAQIKIEESTHNENITILEHNENNVKVAEMKKPQCVDDCGCFGDAMKGSLGRSLSPAESFWKDLILLYLVIILFVIRRKIKPNTITENIVLITTSTLFIILFSAIFSWYFPVLFGLLSLLLALWIKRTGGKLFGNDIGILLLLTLTSSLFVAYIMFYNPIKDYRPYAEGNNIRERMSDGEDGIFESIFIYENLETGEEIQITALDENTKNIWGNTDLWKWKETIQKTIKAGRLPSITDQFSPKVDVSMITETEAKHPYIDSFIEQNQATYIDVIDKNNGNHYPQLIEEFYAEDWDTSKYYFGDTILQLNSELSEIKLLDYILDAEQIFLIIAKDLKNANFSRIERLKTIVSNAQEQGIDILLMTAATEKDIAEFRNNFELYIPTILNDETEIKAISRSNPTLMVLQKGVVKGKYPFRSTPSWDWLIKNNIIQL